MSSGLRIVVVGDMWSVGPVPMARCPCCMGGITTVGNVDAFPGTSFGWFYPQPVSLLTRQNVPLSTSLNAGRCECL